MPLLNRSSKGFGKNTNAQVTDVNEKYTTIHIPSAKKSWVSDIGAAAGNRSGLLTTIQGSILPIPSRKHPFTRNLSGVSARMNSVSGLPGRFYTSSNPNITLGTGPFTVEFFCKFSSISSAEQVLYDGTPNGGLYIRLNNTGRIEAGLATSTPTYSAAAISGLVMSAGVWYHVAVTRDSNNIMSIWVNGILNGNSATVTENYTNTGFYIAKYVSQSGNLGALDGSISNYRITKGISLYNSNTFIPPSSILTTTSQGANPANVVFLAMVEDSLADVTGTLSYINSPTANVRLSFSSPFVDNSQLYLDFSNKESAEWGSGKFFGGSTGNPSSYLAVEQDAASAFHFRQKDFTVEAWINMTGNSGAQRGIISTWTGGGQFLLSVNSSNNVLFQYTNTESGVSTISVTGMTPLVLNEWYHIAVVRYGSTITIYLNGQIETVYNAGADLVTYQNQTIRRLTVGTDDTGGNNYLVGYISNARIVHGQAVYTSAFNPPSRPLNHIPKSYTILQTRNPAHNNTFIDGSQYDAYIQKTGSPTNGSYTPFSSNWSYKFSGNVSGSNGFRDTVMFPQDSNHDLGAGDFTIEFWLNVPRWSNGVVIAGKQRVTSSNGWAILQDSGSQSQKVLFRTGTSNLFYSNSQPTEGLWEHWAITRAGNTSYWWKNGQMDSVSVTGNVITFINDSTANLYLGYSESLNTFGEMYLSNFRIVKGKALYNSNFTPSLVPLEAQNEINTVVLTAASSRFEDISRIGKSKPNRTSISAAVAQTVPPGYPKVTTFSPFSSVKVVPKTYSYYFGGDTNLSIPLSNNYAIIRRNGLTAEWWMYQTANTDQDSYIVGGVNSSEPGIKLDNAGRINLVRPGITNFAVLPTSYYLGSSTFSTFGTTFGTSNYLTTSASGNQLEWGRDANYTIECWLNLTSYTATDGSTILARRGALVSATDWTFYVSTGGNLTFYNFNGGPSVTLTASTTVPLNQWTHCAVTINGGIARIYLNGVPVTAHTAMPPSNTNQASTYAVSVSSSGYINGTLTNLRVVNECLYTKEFVPPQAQLTAVRGTLLLICQSNSFIDNGPFNFTLTTSGSPTNGALSVPYIGSAGAWRNNWCHVAVTKSDQNQWNVFVNGANIYGTNYDVDWNGTAWPQLGGGPATNSGFMGYLSNFRATKTVLYTPSSSFKPPTEPLQLTGDTIFLTCQDPVPTIKSDFPALAPIRDINLASANTYKLSGAFYSTPSKFNPFGYTVISTPKNDANLYGGSAYFNGAGSYLVVNELDYQRLPGAFTIEGWFNPTNIINGSGNAVIVSKGAAGTGWEVSIGTSNTLVFANASVGLVTPTKVRFNEWNHFAVTRDFGNYAKVFLNGNLEIGGIVTNPFNETANIKIGSGRVAGANVFNGYIAGIKIDSNVVAYANNFIVPDFAKRPAANTVFFMENIPAISDSAGGFNIEESAGNYPYTRSVPMEENYWDNSNRGDSTPTQFLPFGSYYSYYFNGTTDYISVTANDALKLSTGDFTLDCFIYPTAFTSQSTIVGNWNATAESFQFWLNSSGQFLWQIHTQNNTASPEASVKANVWSHLALSRSNGYMRVYINGLLKNITGVTNSANGTVTFQIGAGGQNTNLFNGHISNLRLVKGQALYTANVIDTVITVPTSPLTTTSQGAAASNVSLLTCQSPTIKDNSVNILTLTATGSVLPTGTFPSQFTSPLNADSYTSQLNLNNGAVYFKTGDYLTLTNPSNFVQNQDFTVEMWICPISRPASFDAKFWLPNQGGSGNGRLGLGLDTAGKIVVDDQATGNIITSTLALNNGQWYHIALARSGNRVFLYINGSITNGGSTTYSNWQGTGDTVVIGYRSDVSTYYNGYIKDLRYIRGTPNVYMGINGSYANIIIPTRPLTSIANTTLLLFQGSTLYANGSISSLTDRNTTNANTRIVITGSPLGNLNVSPYNVILNQSNVLIDNAVFFDPNYSFYLKAGPNVQQLIVPNATPFTFETSILPVADNNSMNLLSLGGETNDRFVFAMQNGYLYTNMFGQVSSNLGYPKIQPNVWSHIAYVRQANVGRAYINGQQTSSVDITSGNTLGKGSMTIGADTGGAGVFQGWMKDIRLSIGVARYTANTPGVTTWTTGNVTYLSNSYVTKPLTTPKPYNVVIPSIVPKPNVDYVVVAGGGAGGTNAGAGGGGGGFLQGTFTYVPGVTYSIVIGAGGAAATSASDTINGSNGSNSTLFGYTVFGGGAGGSGSAKGFSGGSGGGTPSEATPLTAVPGYYTGDVFTKGQGYSGGIGPSGTGVTRSTGGGGGASQAGQNGNPGGTLGGTGGNGAPTLITGANIFLAGGGGGGSHTATIAQGGLGGGGAAGKGSPTTASQTVGFNGNVNTGGGGGGGGGGGASISGYGGIGGSGIVILRHPTALPIASTTGSNVLVTTTSSNVVYQFYSSGTIQFP